MHLSSALSWRGGEQQIAWLYHGLAQLGIQQWIGCVQDSELAQWCAREKIPHFCYHKGASINPLPGKKIAAWCRQENIDLLHLHDSHAHTYGLYSQVLWGNRCPMVLSRRVDFPISPNFFSRWKYNHPSIHYVICVSDFIRRLLRGDIKEEGRLVVVHDGIDPERFRFAKDGRLHRELGLPSEVKLIANVAAIAPHKDYFTFVDTVVELEKRALEIEKRYLIIGADGGEEQAIRDYIREQNAEDFIQLLGFRRDIPEILPELDLLLFTSKTEGLGSSLLDAFACRVPVVATRAGGIPEIVVDGETGLLAKVQAPVQLADRVEELLLQPAKQQAMVERAYAFVQGFTGQAMAQKTLAIYQQLFNTNH